MAATQQELNKLKLLIKNAPVGRTYLTMPQQAITAWWQQSKGQRADRVSILYLLTYICGNVGYK